METEPTFTHIPIAALLMKETALSEIHTLSLHDALPISGERIFMVYGGETSKAFAGLGQGRRIRLVEEDLELLKGAIPDIDRKSTRLNSSHVAISYAVFCLKKKIRCGCPNWERMSLKSRH